jgi:hypothetical protein
MENAPIPFFGRFSPNAMSFDLYDDDAMVACQLDDFKPL